jgi:hypothetical protein
MRRCELFGVATLQRETPKTVRFSSADSGSDTPITGKFTHTDQGWFRNGKLCEDLQS